MYWPILIWKSSDRWSPSTVLPALVLVFHHLHVHLASSQSPWTPQWTESSCQTQTSELILIFPPPLHLCQLLLAQVHLDPPGGGGANHGGLVEGEGETGKWITGDPHFFFEPYNIMIFVNFFRWRSIPGVELPAFQLHKSLEVTTYHIFLRNRIGNNDASRYLRNFFWVYFVQETKQNYAHWSTHGLLWRCTFILFIPFAHV